jgi:hypothetical protein
MLLLHILVNIKPVVLINLNDQVYLSAKYFIEFLIHHLVYYTVLGPFSILYFVFIRGGVYLAANMMFYKISIPFFI